MIYVVTAVHNRYKITEKFVSYLNEQTVKEKIRFVLVDDGCTDGTAEMVKKEFPDSMVLKGDGNLWWGGALHMAYKYISSLPETSDDDIVLTANDDIDISNDFIEKGAELLKKNPNCLITACGYSKNDSKLIDGAVGYDFKTGNIERLAPGADGNCASTRALFMTMKTYKHIGGFHPVLLPHYASDYEYTIRAYKKGHRILSFDELKYIFDENTTGDNDLSKLTLKKMFTKRSRFNPIYKLSFLFMVTPVKYLPKNIITGFRKLK